MTDKMTPEQSQRREAQRLIDRVEGETETIGTSSFVRVANQAREHMSGADADPDDRVERWAKRFGRALSVVAFVALAIWLLNYLQR